MAHKLKQKISYQRLAPIQVQPLQFQIVGKQLVSYFIAVSKDQEQILQTQNFILVDEVKNNNNERIPHCKAFFISKKKENLGIELYHNVDEKIDDILHNNQKAPFFAIIQKRNVEKWWHLKAYQVSQLAPELLEKFIFSLLYYVNQDLKKFKIIKIKKCNFSFNENIYFYERDNKIEFKIFFTELYLLNQFQKDKDATEKKYLSQNDIYCNVIFQLFHQNINLLQEPGQLDTKQIQRYERIYNFFQTAQKNTNSLQQQQQVNSELRSFLCENLFKDQSMISKIQSLN
ncbi:hypothetical protein ABPG72_006127 [Tetrahymena utriculariae]